MTQSEFVSVMFAHGLPVSMRYLGGIETGSREGMDAARDDWRNEFTEGERDVIRQVMADEAELN